MTRATRETARWFAHMSEAMQRMWARIPADDRGALENARRREHGLTSEELYPAAGKSRLDKPASPNSRNSEQKD